MTGKSSTGSPRVTDKTRAGQVARRDRKAALLRDNLRKRKAQSRERTDTAPDSVIAAPPPHDPAPD